MCGFDYTELCELGQSVDDLTSNHKSGKRLEQCIRKDDCVKSLMWYCHGFTFGFLRICEWGVRSRGVDRIITNLL